MIRHQQTGSWNVMFFSFPDSVFLFFFAPFFKRLSSGSSEWFILPSDPISVVDGIVYCLQNSIWCHSNELDIEIETNSNAIRNFVFFFWSNTSPSYTDTNHPVLQKTGEEFPTLSPKLHPPYTFLTVFFSSFCHISMLPHTHNTHIHTQTGHGVTKRIHLIRLAVSWLRCNSHPISNKCLKTHLRLDSHGKLGIVFRNEER